MKLRLWRQRLFSLAGALLLGACTTVVTPDARATSDEQIVDPPARVGRLSALKGEVQIASEPQGAWEPARLNWPLTTQSMLFVAPGGLSEARIGSSAVRLDGNTQAAFAQLDDHAIAIDLIQGTVRTRVRTLFSGDQFGLAADGVRAELLQPGDYRASFDPDRRAFTLAVLSGRLRVVTPSNTLELGTGQQADIGAGGATLQLTRIDGDTDFDRWAEARDRSQERVASTRYVSPELTGVESLDEYGRWSVDSAYGNVWFPNVVSAGWAPYRHGRWVWVRPWGWSWVDDSPWGYAPFHYGRWSQFGGRWGWVPGPVVARPVWSPALVGYVGGGVYRYPSRAPSGWFPLAPTEVYIPHHRYSPRYVQQYNGGNFNVIAPPHTVVLPADGDRRARRHNGPEQPQPGYRYAGRPDALTMAGDQPARDGRPVGPVRPQPVPVPVGVPMPVPMAVPVPLPGPRVSPGRQPAEPVDDLLRRAQQYPQQPYRQYPQQPQQPQQQRPAPVAPLSVPVPVAAPLPTARPPQMAPPPPVPAAQPAPVNAEPRRPRPETDKEKDKDRYDSTPGQRRLER